MSSKQHLNNWHLILLTAILITVLIGCTTENQNNPTTISSTKTIELSAELQIIYKQTCASCHTNTATGAPQTGDQDAWSKILAKGLNATLENAINGYGGMPPSGQCFECTPDQLVSLIRFMSDSK